MTCFFQWCFFHGVLTLRRQTQWPITEGSSLNFNNPRSLISFQFFVQLLFLKWSKSTVMTLNQWVIANGLFKVSEWIEVVWYPYRSNRIWDFQLRNLTITSFIRIAFTGTDGQFELNVLRNIQKLISSLIVPTPLETFHHYFFSRKYAHFNEFPQNVL